MRAGAWSSNRDIRAARISWERARRVADALPANDPERTAMRIRPENGAVYEHLECRAGRRRHRLRRASWAVRQRWR